MNLIKRTRRKALELGLELWIEIRDKNLSGKLNASIWQKVKTAPRRCAGCFACEYHFTHAKIYCLGGTCILSNIWPEHCCDGDTTYIKWAYAETDTERYDAADAIVKGIEEALELLDKKEK